MRDPAIALLAELVSIDSVNPALVSGGAGETEIAEAVSRHLQASGLRVERQDAAPGRPNIVGVLEGLRPGRSLMLCGHLDTVGVEGMPAPFHPVEREGRLYGRGAQDMKGGLAAILSAAEAPRGRAAHGSRPAEGEDAILRMGRVLGRLESLSAELASRPPHPLLGSASLHGSLIEGGRELSTYPDRCVLQLERRTLPGEAPDAALSELRGILESLAREDPAFRSSVRHLFSQPPYATPAVNPIVEDLASVLASSGREARREGMSFWTDAAILGSAGIPSVVFGPGGSGLHGLEEYVRTEEVVLCRDVLVETAIRYCAGQAG